MREGTWRAAVRNAARKMRWVASLPTYYPREGLNGPSLDNGQILSIGAVSGVVNRKEDLAYFQGRTIRLWPGCTTSWRVELEHREEDPDAPSEYIDAVGFAILDPVNPGEILAAYEWNQDGMAYPQDYSRYKDCGFPVEDFKVQDPNFQLVLDDQGYRGRLEIKVTYKRHRIVATVAVASVTNQSVDERDRQTIDMGHNDKGTMLRIRDGQRDMVDPVFGRERTLAIAPFCDLSRGSIATLSWSQIAQNRGPTWREIRLSDTETGYESR